MQPIEDAVDKWKGALNGELNFDNDDGPFRFLDMSSSGDTDACNDDVAGEDVDILVVWQKMSGSSLYDSEKSDVTNPDEPPRKYFVTDSVPAYYSDDHATLIYRDPDASADVRVSTLVHELGHALGLSDYKTTTCSDLHGTGGGTIVADPDPTDQHLALMYNDSSRNCRPQPDETVITGRDLRDLYEAYHVGAITDIIVPGDVTLTTKYKNGIPVSTVELAFEWGDAGIAEAGHNAAYIVVRAKERGSKTWRVVGHESIWTAGVGSDLRDRISVAYTSSTIAEYYSVAGATQGDIQEQPAIDESVEFAPTATGKLQTFALGDPTFVVGVEEYDAGDNSIVPPEILSASISPRYCWQNGLLDVVMTVTGGASTGATSARGADLLGYSSEVFGSSTASRGCGTLSGKRTFRARGAWGSGLGKVTRELPLSVSVHNRPKPLVWSAMISGAAACVEGEKFQVVLDRPNGGTPPYRIWARDHLLGAGTVSLDCVPPVGLQRFWTMVVDARGAGVKQRLDVSVTSPPTGATVAVRAGGTRATIAEEANEIVGMSISQAGSAIVVANLLGFYYEVRKDGKTVPVTPALTEPRFVFQGLTPLTEYTFGIRLVVNEIETEWIDKQVTTYAIDGPEAVTGTVTSGSATLTWSAVSGASGVRGEIRRGRNHSFHGSVGPSSYVYRLSVEYGV